MLNHHGARESSWLDLPGVDLSAEHVFDAGDIVFRQGEPVASLYLVRVGRVRLIRHLQDGSSVVLHVAQANATFAEAALFSDIYHCDALAEIPSVVTAIPKETLLAALRMNPVGSLDFARALAGQVRDLRAQLEVRNIRSASARLLAWLRLSALGEPLVVEIDRPWTDVAAEIGLTHETIYRTLAELERTGEVVREGRKVTLRGRLRTD